MALIIAKMTDGVLMTVQIESIKWFSNQIHPCFGLSKSIIDNTVDYDGCKISHEDEGNITMSMKSYLKKTSPIDMGRARRNHTIIWKALPRCQSY